jgi:hypothetical protein
VHCWVSLRRADVSELQKEWSLCFSNDPHSEPGRQAVKGDRGREDSKGAALVDGRTSARGAVSKR